MNISQTIYFWLLFISLPAFMVLGGCGTEPNAALELQLGGRWQQVVDQQVSIRRIKKNNNRLYLATDTTGVLAYDIDSASRVWFSLGLNDATVRDVVIWNSSEILASAFHPDSSIYIYKTTNGGKSWKPFQNGFGGEKNLEPTAFHLAPKNPDVIIAAQSAAIIRSKNRGQSWEPIHLDWDYCCGGNFITLLDEDPSNIWAGGSNAGFGPSLVYSNDNGRSWNNLTVIERVETGVYDLIAYPSKPKILLAGLGGGGFRSTNHGKAWKQTLETASVLALAQSPRHERRVYASGANATGSLFFAASGNFGKSWETVSWDGGPADLWINDMVVVTEDGKEVLYFGTNKGLYSYTFAE